MSENTAQPGVRHRLSTDTMSTMEFPPPPYGLIDAYALSTSCEMTRLMSIDALAQICQNFHPGTVIMSALFNSAGQRDALTRG